MGDEVEEVTRESVDGAKNEALKESRMGRECPVLLPMLLGRVGGFFGWRLGVVASVVRRMNEVTVHWARLVLGWVTVFGRVYHHGV